MSTVGLSEAMIAKHVREQEKSDIALDRPSVRKREDSFARRQLVRPARHGSGHNAA